VNEPNSGGFQPIEEQNCPESGKKAPRRWMNWQLFFSTLNRWLFFPFADYRCEYVLWPGVPPVETRRQTALDWQGCDPIYHFGHSPQAETGGSFA